jgi:hypothetical protein
MSNWMVTVSFRYDLEPERFDAENGPEIAQRVAGFPGLLWKIWLHSSEGRRCQGVYRFADEASARAYADGPVVSHLREAEGYRDVDAQVWGVLEENSRITRAPGLDEPALV